MNGRRRRCSTNSARMRSCSRTRTRPAHTPVRPFRRFSRGNTRPRPSTMGSPEARQRCPCDSPTRMRLPLSTRTRTCRVRTATARDSTSSTTISVSDRTGFSRSSNARSTSSCCAAGRITPVPTRSMNARSRGSRHGNNRSSSGTTTWTFTDRTILPRATENGRKRSRTLRHSICTIVSQMGHPPSATSSVQSTSTTAKSDTWTHRFGSSSKRWTTVGYSKNRSSLSARTTATCSGSTAGMHIPDTCTRS